jgi:hypothetical protein
MLAQYSVPTEKYIATSYLPLVDASGNTTSITLCYETGNWHLCLIRFRN